METDVSYLIFVKLYTFLPNFCMGSRISRIETKTQLIAITLAYTAYLSFEFKYGNHIETKRK